MFLYLLWSISSTRICFLKGSTVCVLFTPESPVTRVSGTWELLCKHELWDVMRGIVWDVLNVRFLLDWWRESLRRENSCLMLQTLHSCVKWQSEEYNPEEGVWAVPCPSVGEIKLGEKSQGWITQNFCIWGRRIGDRRATSVVEREPGGSDVMEATEETVARRFD